MAVLKLIPACKDYLWGGTKLRTELGKKSDSEIIAETWELSCHPDGMSIIDCTGETLVAYLSAHPEQLGSNCAKFEEFPILIKLIDAAKDLSIQVHPDNAFAQKYEGQYGKTEMWYIVSCDDSASLYYGFEKEISLEDFRKAIESNTLCKKLHKVKVKKGDVFFIESGTIHAIGAGIVIAEIQQSSNVTYRVYDYGRLGTDGKPRELHLEKACEVTTLTPVRTDFDFGEHLAQCTYFTVDKFEIDGTKTFVADNTSFHSLLFIGGEAEIYCQNTNISAKNGDSFFIGADSGEYTIVGNYEVIVTTV